MLLVLLPLRRNDRTWVWTYIVALIYFFPPHSKKILSSSPLNTANRIEYTLWEEVQ